MKPLPVLQCCAPVAADLSDDEAAGLETLFAALADKHRVKIISHLLKFETSACCVCELEPQLGISQPTVSYHLKRLTDVGMLEREKRGTFAYYRLAPEAIDRVRALFG
ncbi:MAG TPA: metalloregulator ArsR/SmtB family transcription factor [Gaiellaceae bacterium]